LPLRVSIGNRCWHFAGHRFLPGGQVRCPIGLSKPHRRSTAAHSQRRTSTDPEAPPHCTRSPPASPPGNTPRRGKTPPRPKVFAIKNCSLRAKTPSGDPRH
jgi:hypothetical protein